MDVILGTAGHIDHGKTSLVAALTGIDCDRLEEEKRRGITIETGFAWLDLPDRRRLGIVDVPGHERFIKNMVAGASGVDCVLLVIAANEGVMPQTREHLEICSLLGIRAGLVALTKIDLVDEEWLGLVREDLANTLAGSFLENAPVVPVSSATGEGLEELRAEIFRTIQNLESVPKTDILRLPVDRVFSLKGFGTIVTGSLVSGSCSQGERLCIVPSGKTARARSLQVHNVPVESAHAGQRCAINLQGLEVSDIERGDIIARPDTLFPSRRWFIRLHCLKSSPLPLRQRMEVHFHHGSRECLARIIFRDREALAPGETCIAEARFKEPLAAVYGDHCVLRAHSPLRAIGGGIVINPLPPVLNRRDRDFARKYACLLALGEPDRNKPAMLAKKSPEELLARALCLYPAPGLDINQLQALTALPKAVLAQSMAMLEQKGDAFRWDPASWIGRASLEECLEKCLGRAQELHNREPLKTCFASSALICGWGENLPGKFTLEILQLAVNRGLLRQEGTGLRLAGHEIKFSKAETRIINLLLDKITAGGLTPPPIREIAEQQRWEIKAIAPLLRYLCETSQLLKIQEGLYCGKAAFATLEARLAEWFQTHETLEVGDMKELIGVSRKFAIPLLEYLDAQHITYRVNNQRRLRPAQH